MIRNIVFDFGRVLVDYSYSMFLASIIEDERERASFRAVFCEQEFCNYVDRGEESFPQIIEKMRAKYPQWDSYIEQFGTRQLDVMTGEVPGMRKVLERLKADGYGLYGLTNWSCAVYPVIEKYDILRMLDGRVISSEEHLIKPEAAIYERLCEKYSLKIDECLFTDDKQINIDGARAAGMKAILFKNADQFVRDLKEIISIS